MNSLMIDPAHLHLVDGVVSELIAGGRISPESIMLVGAECRDILHRSYGHDFALRKTSDLDLAIAINDWGAYGAVLSGFPATGSTGIRFTVAGMPVDIMPFGAIERPTGEIVPTHRTRDPISVFAFQEVHESAATLSLPSGVSIRIPTRAGYASLKLRAWRDRWTAMHEVKDGPDLATIVYWYIEDAAIATRLYRTPDGVKILTAVNFDVPLASAYLLGQDAMALIGATRASEFRDLWRSLEIDPLARVFGNEDLPAWPADRSRRRELVQALSDGIAQR